MGAAFLLGAAIGSALTLWALGEDEATTVPSRKILRIARHRAGSDADAETHPSVGGLRGVLAEEATHLVRTVGGELAELAADRLRSRVLGYLEDDVEEGEEDLPLETDDPDAP